MTTKQRLNRVRGDIQTLALVNEHDALQTIYDDVSHYVLDAKLHLLNKKLAMLEQANAGLAAKVYGDDSAGWVERLACDRYVQEEINAMLEQANAGLAAKVYGDDSAGWVERLESEKYQCTICGRVGSVGRCCGEETRVRIEHTKKSHPLVHLTDSAPLDGEGE
ncbi:MAG: hypothetical protein O2931_08350 [Planctomycetota bacterium]|nr:hypothetical protein [Planctomycetota bacterium]